MEVERRRGWKQADVFSGAVGGSGGYLRLFFWVGSGALVPGCAGGAVLAGAPFAAFE